MAKNLAFEFLVNKETNTITVRREFAAELPLVWDAYTKSELLDQWWAPKPWKARTKSMDFREGGHWHYAMVGPDGEVHWGLTSYHTIQLHEYFIGIDAFADEQANINHEWPQSSWKIVFTTKHEKTLVENQIIYNDLAQLESTIQMGFKEGLTAALEGLDELFILLKS
ncbi:SRPBCC family protein [Arundinibacter roseus]|uniref:SRPBCC domain-containing protein n=1 Tax=Arundinibacter roseus TaxID=2070510 RepID=A0A4R4KHH9_9BACT|nr:SRPBCC domain-containing protein [Arundinibacter roseus]TDB67564.1 SRPBCC domain-containing protein [Arundinibacter roseus]